MNDKTLARIKMDNATETYSDDEIICPWCHEKMSDSYELDDDGGEVDCGDCGKTFIYSIHRSVSYSGHLPDEELDKRVGGKK